MPINVPQYLHLDLSKHVMRNICRFCLRAHTLKVEAAAWHEDGSCVCDQWLQWLQLGVTFSQVVWLIGC